MTGKSSKARHKFSLVACARWEEKDIVEWVEYHLAIGIEHFYIYSNDDSPTTLFKVLSPYIFGNDPVVTFRHWPIPGQQPQMYFHFLEHFLAQTEWFCFLDIDEFLVFKNVNSIGDFMARFETSHDAVYLNWLLYGNNFLTERDDDSVLFAYTRRASFIDHHTKVITRAAAVDPDRVKERFLAGAIGFWHFWNDYGFENARLVNAIGSNVDGYTQEFPKAAVEQISRRGVSDAMIDTAYVAHFQFKSERDFIRRARRGGFQISATWEKMYADGSYKKILDQTNAVEDTYLAAFWAKTVGDRYNTTVLSNVPVPHFANVALRKPSRQSSLFSEAQVKLKGRVQGHANDGFRTGTFGFHTAFEDEPWWAVDLLERYVIKAVHIYNRIDDPALAVRARHIAIEISSTGSIWTEVYAHKGAPAFQGTNGRPLVVAFDKVVVARHLRIISRTKTFLHLDEVEVYGISATST